MMHMTNRRITSALALVACALAVGASCNGEPDIPDVTPNYRSIDSDPSNPSSGERGNMQVTEIGWAGSVTDEGEWDPEDIFIEFQNRNPRPMNLSGWRLLVEGDHIQTYRIPSGTEDGAPIVEPNGFFVIAAKPDGAFGDVADVILPDLKFGKTYLHIDLLDNDRRKMEQVGSGAERIFCGGWDTVTTRSMERVQLIFGNQGGQSRNWHAFSDDLGTDTVAEGFRQYTLASPGLANSRDYSGSSSSGGFE